MPDLAPCTASKPWMRKPLSLALAAACATALCAADDARAWTRPGHMVTAAIAWDDLSAADAAVIARLGELLSQHPDRGAFEVAAGRSEGSERVRRLVLECARWPDDARGSVYDHPTWHYAMRPVVHGSEAKPPAPDPVGDAVEAFALHARVLANPRAADAERAVALCWVMHVAGDVHQPLHAAELYSAAFPGGDRGGTLAFVKDPQSGEAVTLHWFWDDAVHRTGEPETVEVRARELEAKHPRSSLNELHAAARAIDLPRWLEESHALAESVAYRGDPGTGTTKETAAALSREYVAAATETAERRVALAGYRLADLLREALGQH